MARRKAGYRDCARSGLRERLPPIECFENQFPGYTVTVSIPEFTSLCPKTGLPDFGTITIEYVPDKLVMELKSLKMYIHGYRSVGIFNENAVNRILRDVVRTCRPVRATVKGEFRPRGGISTTVTAVWPALDGKRPVE